MTNPTLRLLQETGLHRGCPGGSKTCGESFRTFQKAGLLARPHGLPPPFPEAEIPLAQEGFQRNPIVLKLKVGCQNLPETVEREVVVFLQSPAAGEETFQHFLPIAAPHQQSAQIQQSP